MERVETLVIGGGQAGLAMSYHLDVLGLEHIVLERATVAQRWRSERWDSLMFQFPNWSIALPGCAYSGDDPDGFSHKDAVVHFIENYAAQLRAPVRTGTNVSRLRSTASKDGYAVVTDRGDFEAHNVVIATGPYQRRQIPPDAARVPSEIVQLHARDYRDPAVLPAGAVLVVGSGASGCQIADELLNTGRRVYLSVGRHDRLPRRYRGRDVIWWLLELGHYGPAETAVLPEAFRTARFLLTGAQGGYDIDLRRSADRGMTLLGHLGGVADGRLFLLPDIEESLKHGDDAFREFTRAADDYIERTGIDAPGSIVESTPIVNRAVDDIREIDLKAAQIRSVIWATGYSLDFGWVELPIFNERGEPVHQRGVARAAAGIYFLGLQKLHTPKSSTLLGVGEDAAYLAEHIAKTRR